MRTNTLATVSANLTLIEKELSRKAPNIQKVPKILCSLSPYKTTCTNGLLHSNLLRLAFSRCLYFLTSRIRIAGRSPRTRRLRARCVGAEEYQEEKSLPDLTVLAKRPHRLSHSRI